MPSTLRERQDDMREAQARKKNTGPRLLDARKSSSFQPPATTAAETARIEKLLELAERCSTSSHIDLNTIHKSTLNGVKGY